MYTTVNNKRVTIRNRDQPWLRSGLNPRTLLEHSLNGRKRGLNFDSIPCTKWGKNRKHMRCLGGAPLERWFNGSKR